MFSQYNALKVEVRKSWKIGKKNYYLGVVERSSTTPRFIYHSPIAYQGISRRPVFLLFKKCLNWISHLVKCFNFTHWDWSSSLWQKNSKTCHCCNSSLFRTYCLL